MKEEFLHFVWKNRLFGTDNLKTNTGKLLQVVDPGTYNRDSGPDFFNARIKIDDTEWAGNVEIHFNASDWYRHNHHTDHSYDNIILHVVTNNDEEISTASGYCPESFILNWDKQIEDRYKEYLSRPGIIACSHDLDNLPGFSKRHWISRMAIEKLQTKYSDLKAILKSVNGDWDEALYRLISRYFGMKVNSDPFYLLASGLPLKIIRKHADNRFQIESLMYGQAGMLEKEVFSNEVYDEYYFALTKEFTILRSKYGLTPMESWLWKYHRLRPANFPTIRISQLAGLLSRNMALFSIIKECNSTDELISVFSSEASEYWNNHYSFGKYRKGKKKKTGKIMINLLVINTVIPLLFLYGRTIDDNKYCARAVDLLDKLDPEDNRIIREWIRAGIEPVSALESQGLIHLREKYCKNRLCLHCQYGSKLICLGKDINPRRSYSLEDPLI